MNINIGIITLLLFIGIVCFFVHLYKHGRDLEFSEMLIFVGSIFILAPLALYSGHCFLHPEESMIKLNSLVVFENKQDSRIDELQRKYDELLKLKVAEVN